MQGIGSLLFLGGVISSVLYFVNMELLVLAWIDNWGATTGWIIRGAMIVVGALLWGVSMARGGGDQ
jgi:hypothetical protein